MVWAVFLLVLAYLSVRRDEPTVREQRSLAQATSVVDRAVGALVVAAGPDVMVELADRRVRTGCRISLLRAGAILDVQVVVRGAAADGPVLLDRIAERLPSGYRAGVRRGEGGAEPTLRANAGEFVTIRGGVTGPGVVTLTLGTGCRPTP